MDTHEYQASAARTECNQRAARQRMYGMVQTNPHLSCDPALLEPIRLNHAIIGLAGEVGELAATVEKWLYYGQPLDRVHLLDELGDALWYIALACNAAGLNLGDVMAANIAKLKARYPHKYEDVRAAEEGRDRVAERACVEKYHDGQEGVE